MRTISTEEGSTLSALRFPRVKVTPISMAYLARRPPWTAVWWSVALPGFGHLWVGQFLKGFVLMTWEILINHKAHLNMAIYFTLLGQYDRAREVLDFKWVLVYPLFYLFSMFDAYRLCVELNVLTDLERVRKRRKFELISVTPLGVTTLSRRSPIMAAFWSATISGFGQLYNERGIKALSMMGWYLVVVLKSGLSTATFYTLTGQFHLIPQVIDFQWLLFWPSIWVFGIVDAYTDAVQQNQLSDESFRWRLRKYVRNGG